MRKLLIKNIKTFHNKIFLKDKFINMIFRGNNKNFSLTVNDAIKNLKLPTVTIVRDKEHAMQVLDILKNNRNRFHAWDTETIDIDIKEQSPVLFGKIICMSCFIGPDIDFGNGPSKQFLL